MKNFLALILIMSAVNLAAAAQDCGSVDEKKDAFSGKTVKSARIVVGNLRAKWLVNMDQSDGATYMKWSIAVLGEFNQILPLGTVMMLKLENGTILELKTVEPTSPVTQAINSAGSVTVFSTYNLKFSLSKENLTPMSKSPISDLKIDVPGLTIKNAKLKDKQMEKIKDVSGCLLSTI